MAERNPNPATVTNTVAPPGIPGSAGPAHPTDGIPLPPHGFEVLDLQMGVLASIPASDTISRAAQLLINAAAEKLGLVPGEEPDLDLDEARWLVTALAGLLAASQAVLDTHWEPLRDGLRTLQNAFREASARPDPPGQGPGEQLLS